jgi:hypothetical protein
MTSPTPLHWSIDHGDHHRQDLSFSGELRAALESSRRPVSSVDDAVRRRYTVLPNYWNGYAGDCDVLAFGELSLERTCVSAGYRYRTSYSNDASGESISLDYETTDGTARAIVGPWSMATTNRSGDLYDSSRTTGACVERPEGRCVELRVNDRLTFQSGVVPEGQPLCCTTSLFDSLGEWTCEADMRLCLLEELTKIKCDCRISPIGETDIELSRSSVTLRGWATVGPSEPPSYWWLDEAGRVAIASNVFCTFVLTEGT